MVASPAQANAPQGQKSAHMFTVPRGFTSTPIANVEKSRTEAQQQKD